MKKKLRIYLLYWTLTATMGLAASLPAFAQDGEASASQIANGGVITGNIVDGSNEDQNLAHQQFILKRHDAGAVAAADSYETGSDGRFHVSSLVYGPEITYQIIVPFAGGNYSEDIVLSATGTADVTVRVYDGSADTSKVRVLNFGAAWVFVDGERPEERFIEVREVYKVNHGGDTYLTGNTPYTDGRPGEAVLTFPFPPNAIQVQEIGGLKPSEFGPVADGVGTGVPLAPGETVDYQFRYFLPLDNFDSQVHIHYPVARARLAIEDRLADLVAVEGLEDQGKQTIQGAGQFHVYQSSNLLGHPEWSIKAKPSSLLVLVIHIAVLVALIALVGGGLRVTLRKRRQALELAEQAAGGATAPTAPVAETPQSAAPVEKKRGARGRSRRREMSDSERLVNIIATLDILHDEQEIETEVYEQKRARFKQELETVHRQTKSATSP